MLLHKPHLPQHLPFSSMVIVGLAMSIGWGIRGNFGHQYGAAFAGCLASMTLCLFSGREDWRQKLLFFGFFGAVAWGFGATISYMQVISYTESGQTPTQLFGYLSLFVIGFLWASLGVAGPALVAVMGTKKLMDFFKPILFVFAAWLVLDLIEDPLADLIQPVLHFDSNRARQRNPFYWFDANYLPPLFALIGASVYDLIERREKNARLVLLYGAMGALGGWLLQSGLRAAGWENKLSAFLTYSLGDPAYLDPETGRPAFEVANLLNNWPQWFNDYPHQIGWVIGLVTGLTVYFIRFGKFRNSASLIVYMAAGWFLFFLAMPVLGSLFFKGIGGIRMTPPRSDDWAGMVGVFAGVIYWFRKNNYTPAALASMVGGTIGGLGFSGIQWLKQVLMAPGNPRILQAKGLMPGSVGYERIAADWGNWQHQNWHSFLEQSYGFVNGLAIVIALGILAKKLPIKTSFPQMPYSLAAKKRINGFCAIFIILVIPYVNIIKNVEVWSHSLKPEVWQTIVKENDGTQSAVAAHWKMPYVGYLPGADAIGLTPEGWFNTIWILLLAAMIGLVYRHYKYPLELIPKSSMGKAQLFILILLWTMVLGNFDRELLQWAPGRLLTEWVITVNAVILTYFILSIPKETDAGIMISPSNSFDSSYKRSWKIALLTLALSSAIFLFSNRWIYQYAPNEKLDTRRMHLRFGPSADWRSSPILKNGEHK